jgi:hypothetical protein
MDIVNKEPSVKLDKTVANNPALFRAYMRQIPAVDLRRCEYVRERRVLKLASEFMGMPREFYVNSHHTGKQVRFVAVGPEDVLFDEDQWDGEQQIYRPVGNVPNVEYMVIYNQW